MESWGPSHQSTGTPKLGGWLAVAVRVVVVLAALGVLNGATDGESTGTIVGNTVTRRARGDLASRELAAVGTWSSPPPAFGASGGGR